MRRFGAIAPQSFFADISFSVFEIPFVQGYDLYPLSYTKGISKTLKGFSEKIFKERQLENDTCAPAEIFCESTMDVY